MKRLAVETIVLILIVFLMTGCSLPLIGNTSSEDKGADISRHPPALELARGKLSYLPEFDKYSSDFSQVDLRGYDVSGLDMSTNLFDLMHSDFDTKTRWPYALPGEFNPKKIMELGRNPGLGIRELHEKDITGKGVGIAIIGTPILVEHSEYRDRLKVYHEVDKINSPASSSGMAVASIAAGETVGVAPGADIYYISGKFAADKSKPDGKVRNTLSSGYNGLSTIDDDSRDSSDTLVATLNKVCEINEGLPGASKIRVLCISFQWAAQSADRSDVMKAVNRLKKAGIFIVSPDIYESYDHSFDFNGLGRNPLSNPEKMTSYAPGISWANNFYSFGRYSRALETLLVPMDSRTVASPTGGREYAFYSMSDRNIADAYIAGLYAMACQVKIDITPELFWKDALETGKLLSISRNNIKYSLKKVVDPLGLIQKLRQ